MADNKLNTPMSRKRILETLSDDIRPLVELSQKKFRLEQPETSADSVFTHDSHMIYYPYFLKHPIKLESNITVRPEKLAEAFLQMDLTSIAKVLCEAIFSDDDLKRRAAGGIDKLPNVKKVAIYRAAKWMSNKNQNPWDFKPTEWPRTREIYQIDKAFEEFNQVDPVYTEGFSFDSADEVDNALSAVQGAQDAVMDNNTGFYSMSTMSRVIPQFSSLEELDQLDLANELAQLQLSENQEDQLSAIGAELLLDLKLQHVHFPCIFKHAMKLNEKKKTSAQVSKEMTQNTLPYNTDVFVDAVQFSKERWARAMLQVDVSDIAFVLFSKYVKIEFPEGDCIDFDQLSAPRRLAIIRATAFIKQKRSYDFDACIPDHNLFLTAHEMQKVRRVINERLRQHRSTIAVVAPQPGTSFDSMTHPQEQTFATPPSEPVLQDFIGEAAPPQNLEQEIVFNGHTFPESVWEKARKLFKSDEMEKAGKYLFDSVFTDEEEILNSTISGKPLGRRKFCQIKVDSIFDTLEFLKASSGESTEIKFTKTDKKHLLVKVFAEHANYRRKKIKESRLERE